MALAMAAVMAAAGGIRMTEPGYLELWRRAEENLAKLSGALHTKPPAYTPQDAGINGIIITGLVLTLFTGFANIELDAYPLSMISTLAIGFGGPYLYFRNETNRHNAKVRAEIDRLRRTLNSIPVEDVFKNLH
jgi:hypothetical protein